jgi:hypothetical protein
MSCPQFPFLDADVGFTRHEVLFKQLFDEAKHRRTRRFGILAHVQAKWHPVRRQEHAPTV